MNIKRLALIFAISAGLSGCVSNNQYYWGQYENLIYKMYLEPGSAQPQEQIVKLTQDIERAEAAGKPVPPGVFAHLGLMYAQVGNASSANNAFENEKRLYPDSKVLIEGMQNRASKTTLRQSTLQQQSTLQKDEVSQDG